MVHAKNEAPATINNAANTIFNFSFILLSFYLSQNCFIIAILQSSSPKLETVFYSFEGIISFINSSAFVLNAFGIYNFTEPPGILNALIL